MNLINKEVVHKSFGDGNIIEQDDSFITISFETESKKFVFPDAFGSFLKLKDREAAETLKEVITKIQAEQVIIEQKKEEARKEEILKQERLNEYKQLMKNHTLHESSQIVFWLDDEDIEKAFNEWAIYSGDIKSGKNEGKPNKPVRLHQNSAVLITSREKGEAEKKRIIKGLYMVNETFIGKLSDDGIVPAHTRLRVKLTDEEAEQLLFWNYYINHNYPHRLTWNTGRYRYFDNVLTAQILQDIIGLRKGKEDTSEIEEFLRHFCEMNAIDINDIPEASGALIGN